MTTNANTSGPESIPDEDEKKWWPTSENIVSSVDCSRKLRDAGYPQQATMFWIEYRDEKIPKAKLEHFLMSSCRDCTAPRMTGGSHKGIFAAPSAEEILRRLPILVAHEGDKAMLRCYPLPGIQWAVGYIGDEGRGFSEYGFSLADATAAMFCRLFEQKLIATP